jgi:hypothetical protein
MVSLLALAAEADERLVSLVAELLDRSLEGLPCVPPEHRIGETSGPLRQIVLVDQLPLEWNRPERHFHDVYLPGVRCARSASGGPLSPRSRSLSMQPESERASTAIRSARTSTFVSVEDGESRLTSPYSHSFAACGRHEHELQ